ncbi:MAG: ABC transporter ATP-binding protein [Anaerolineae bacterium]|nr:ABC transporter ATP-binding protein [Anaerolineae bacterium]
MATIVSLRHVTKIFGKAPDTPGDQPDAEDTTGPVYALDDVSFTTHPGEALGILGPSGCGKSTLLRVIAGLETLTSGGIYYDNVPLEDIPMTDRGIGMVFQNYALYPHLPSIENIGFFLRLRKRDSEVPERVREISRLMNIGLGPILSRKPPTLSGGERQRVAIARCLARDPRLFLFDEPFSNLDAKLRTNSRVELKRLLQKYDVTSIYVTHDQQEAIALCDRIAILNHGKLMQLGTHRQLYDTPVNIFVAGFFGSPAMNLFSGVVQNGQWVGSAFTWGPIRRDLGDDTQLVMGVRPEHFVLDKTGELVVNVEMVEPIYGERIQIVYTRLNELPVTLRLPLDIPVQPGERLHLAIDPDHVHLFDMQTGQRLG